MKSNRRNFIAGSVGTLGLMSNAGVLFAEEDKPNPKSNKFLLYLHLGSSCGAANGLVQPLKPGKWPIGFFQSGKDVGANNSLLNQHTAAGGLVFHDYLKFLAPMVKDMCLVSGNPQSLDHNVASLLQKRGGVQSGLSPEWSMGVAEFMRTERRKNPMVLSRANKSASVANITPVGANTLAEFAGITSDVKAIPQGDTDPISAVLRKRFAQFKPGSVLVDPSLAQVSDYQLNTLSKGLPELTAAQADITALRAKLNAEQVKNLVKGCIEADQIENQADNATREQLILAGILAKTGLANGMTINLMGDDLHNGGADVLTARRAAGKWALISLFWEWIRASKLENDVMIVIGQEFARSPYNPGTQTVAALDAKGARVDVVCPGRDHMLCMGMMFINANVPSGGRVGIVGGNLVPQATKDAKGTVDSGLEAYSSADIVGSMLMRCFDDLFPTERMVRKHWPTFKEIAPILA